MDLLVDRVRMIPQLFAAIGTYEQITEEVLFSVLRLRWTAFGSGLYQFLHRFKGFAFNDRLVDVPENRPVAFVIRKSFFVFEGLGIGFEVDDVPAVFLLCEYLAYGARFPKIRIWLCLLSASSETFLVPVCRRVQHLAFSQNAGNRFVAFAVQTHFENIPYYRRRFGFDHPLFLVLGRFHIPIRRL